MKLWLQILIGLLAGIVLGIALGEKADIFLPLGTLFINAIKMLIVPLIFSSLVVGVTSIKEPTKLGRVGLKTVGSYLITTSIAITIGLLVGIISKPGAGLELVSENVTKSVDSPSLIDTFVNLIPQNPIESLASTNILQIIVFSILFGIAINLTRKKSKPIIDFFDSFAEVMYKLTEIVMKFAPIGVFALMASVAGKYGLSVLLSLMNVIAGVFIACIIHAVVTYSEFLYLFARYKPFKFYKNIVEAQMVALTTSSSFGTLPVTLHCVQKKIGVSKGISSFVLPLGATINMDGTALYQGVAALFVANAFGIELTLSNYITIIITSTLASIGTAGVPGAGLIMLSLVLNSVGLPIEGVALIAGIDRLLDMGRTAINVTGDSMIAVLVAKSEGELSLK